MKFSILIPVYNTEKYLSNCLQSIFNQTYENYEVVFVNDGSSDSSGKICDRYATKYPNIKVIHQNNQGQLVSRCNAAKQAVGDYCIYMDSDDIILDNALEQLRTTIERNNEPDIILYPFYYEKNGERTESKRFYDRDKSFSGIGIRETKELFFTTSIMDSMCTKAIKREVLVNSIYDTKEYESLRCSEDRLQALWVMDNVSSAYYLNEPLYVYRLFNGSTTRSFSYDAIENNKTAILYDIEKTYLHKWGFDSEDWIRRFDTSWITYMIYVFLLFYSQCTQIEKDRILSYPWETFIPEKVQKMDINILSLDENKKALYKSILSKNKRKLNSYLYKRKLYTAFRDIKRKVLK